LEYVENDIENQPSPLKIEKNIEKLF